MYVLWFGSQETDKIQITLCVSFALWLFLEIFLYETLSVAFTHLTLPMLIAKELKSTKDYIMMLISTADYTEPDDMDEATRQEWETSFDLRRYLSVCYRLADHSDDMHFERCVIHTHKMKPEDLKPRDHYAFIITHPLLFLLDLLMHLPLSVQDTCIRLFNSGLVGGILISLVFWSTGTHISGAFTNFIIYGAWALVGFSGIYALTTWYRARQSRVQTLNIDDDIASTNEGIRATTYQSDQFVLQKDSFLLREEFKVVQSFADVAVGLNPGEFDTAKAFFLKRTNNNVDAKLQKKISDIQEKDILYLINRSNKDLTKNETLTNETILRFYEINHKKIINKLKQLYPMKYKQIAELFLILLIFNYMNLKDLRYLNLLLKLKDSNYTKFLSKNNKLTYKVIITNLLSSVSNSK